MNKYPFESDKSNARDLVPRIADWRCSYRRGDRRCPAKGTVSPTGRYDGKGEAAAARRWYCQPHYEALTDPVMGRQILDDYARNGMPQKKTVWEDLCDRPIGSDPIRNRITGV